MVGAKRAPRLGRFSNPAWAVVEYGWTPLVLVVATPWVLRCIGSQGYGYWMLLTATVGFGGAVNGGTGAATIKAVSAERGRGAAGEQWIRASLGIAAIGGLAMSGAVLLAYLLGGTQLLGRMAGDLAALQLTGWAAALLLWIEQLDNSFVAALKGSERFSEAAKLEIGGKTLQIGMASLAIVASPTLQAMYGALVIGALMRLGAKAVVVRRLLGLSSLRPSLEGAWTMLRIAGWGWLQGIGTVLFGVADRMVVGALLGAGALAYYSIASQLAMQVHAVSAAALSVVFPLVSRTLESQQNPRLASLLRKTMAANAVLSTALAVGLLFFASLLLEPWIGAPAATSVQRLLPWLTAAYWVLSLNVGPYYVLLGMGRMRYVGIAVLVAGLAGIVSMRWGIDYAGLEGATAGRGVYALVALVLVVPVAPLLRCRLASKDVSA